MPWSGLFHRTQAVKGALSGPFHKTQVVKGVLSDPFHRKQALMGGGHMWLFKDEVTDVRYI